MAETISMPKLGFDMQEGTLVRWVRAEGEAIEKGDVLAEIETDKATVEVESSAAGIIRRLLVDQGAVVPIGSPIAIVGTKDEPIDVPSGGEASSPRSPDQDVQKPQPEASPARGVQATTLADTGSLKASPLARRMARDASIELGNVRGTGPGGRIVRRDIEQALSGGVRPVPRFSPTTAVPTPTGPRADERVALSKLRTAIGKRMAESKSSVPHFYVTHEYDVDSIVELRQQANKVLPEPEKLSVNDFLIRAVALCLREYPNLNAAFQGDTVVRFGGIHIGVAVAIEGGLLTVVCRDADQRSVRDISGAVREMAARARAGKVKPEDIEGSTFSISNLGMFDVENFAAIVNPPEAGILAVASARQVPVVKGASIVAGWRMKTTLSVDHRVSDGAEAARFLQSLASYIESPLSLFL
jgi:pyruvate dehydrogenase E2 component (dihydrolipoamide acetyltransferase)